MPWHTPPHIEHISYSVLLEARVTTYIGLSALSGLGRFQILYFEFPAVLC